jgi:carbonic anhydrase
MVSYNPVNLKKHKSEALVVHCCDPRFQEAYRQAAEQVSEFYDLMVVPGASKAIVDNPTVIKNIKMLHGLHNFSEVHIMDHIECGAFGKIDDEVEVHSKYLHLAQRKINKALPSLKVVSHLLGEKKELEIKEPAEDSSRFKLIDRLRQA